MKNAKIRGFGTACSAIESQCRHLAVELGPKGIRVVCLRSPGSPDAPRVQEVFKLHAAENNITPEELLSQAEQASLLRRRTSLENVSSIAALMASDMARAMTATTANLTCGTCLD